MDSYSGGYIENSGSRILLPPPSTGHQYLSQPRPSQTIVDEEELLAAQEAAEAAAAQEQPGGAFNNVGQGLTGNHRDMMMQYWQETINLIEHDDHDFKNHQLPLARIKKVMKTDEDVRMISAEAPILFAKGCDIFITELTMRAWIHAEENKRRTLQKSDIAAALAKSDMFDFLIDVVPRDEDRPKRLFSHPSMSDASSQRQDSQITLSSGHSQGGRLGASQDERDHTVGNHMKQEKEELSSHHLMHLHASKHLSSEAYQDTAHLNEEHQSIQSEPIDNRHQKFRSQAGPDDENLVVLGDEEGVQDVALNSSLHSAPIQSQQQLLPQLLDALGGSPAIGKGHTTSLGQFTNYDFPNPDYNGAF